jgi:hypothetical protein
MPPPAAAPPSSSALGDLRSLLRKHPFQIVLGTWGSVLALTGAFLWRRQIPFQLKVIQARILAQASLVSGAGVFAALSLTSSEPEAAAGTITSQPSFMLRDFAEVSEAERGRPAMGRNARPAAAAAATPAAAPLPPAAAAELR